MAECKIERYRDAPRDLILQREQVTRVAARLLEADHILLQQVPELLILEIIRRMRRIESCRVASNIAFVENRLRKWGAGISWHEEAPFSLKDVDASDPFTVGREKRIKTALKTNEPSCCDVVVVVRGAMLSSSRIIVN